MSQAGRKLALMSGQTLQKAMVPLTGKSLALYNSSGLLYYAHSDMLGSIRLGTTPGRTTYFDTAYAPFGEPYASIGTLDLSYTGQTNDTSSYRQDTAGGLYDFPLREYSTQGRWPNPDPMGRSSTCPKDPQTQNRYAYVRNNPMTYTDPTGGFLPGPCDPEDPFCGGGGGCDPDDPLCWDPCDQEPWLCFPGTGPVGSGGGFTSGGGNPEQPQFPWPLLPLGFFGNPPPSPGVGSRWSCLNTNKDAKPFWGVCNYGCTRLGYARGYANSADILVSMGQLRRSCGWKASTCAIGLTLSGPEIELDPLLLGWTIESCSAAGMALAP